MQPSEEKYRLMAFADSRCACTETSYHGTIGSYVLNQIGFMNFCHYTGVINFPLFIRMSLFDYPTPPSKDSLLGI